MNAFIMRSREVRKVYFFYIKIQLKHLAGRAGPRSFRLHRWDLLFAVEARSREANLQFSSLPAYGGLATSLAQIAEPKAACIVCLALASKRKKRTCIQKNRYQYNAKPYNSSITKKGL